jgi:hypothetical protein
MPNDPTLATPPVVHDLHAKPLPRRLPLAGSAPPLVPARMINEALYCERLLYLEWAQGEFADNAFTVEGRVAHKRADQPGGKLPPPPPSESTTDDGTARPPLVTDGSASPPEESSEPRPYQARTLWLSSEQLIVHPVFGYRISYRRVLEVQARLLARCLSGEIDAYPSFRTR